MENEKEKHTSTGWWHLNLSGPECQYWTTEGKLTQGKHCSDFPVLIPVLKVIWVSVSVFHYILECDI